MALCSTPLPPYPFVPKENRADGKWEKELRKENVILFGWSEKGEKRK